MAYRDETPALRKRYVNEDSDIEDDIAEDIGEVGADEGMLIPFSRINLSTEGEGMTQEEYEQAFDEEEAESHHDPSPLLSSSGRPLPRIPPPQPPAKTRTPEHSFTAMPRYTEEDEGESYEEPERLTPPVISPPIPPRRKDLPISPIVEAPPPVSPTVPLKHRPAPAMTNSGESPIPPPHHRKLSVSSVHSVEPPAPPKPVHSRTPSDTSVTQQPPPSFERRPSVISVERPKLPASDVSVAPSVTASTGHTRTPSVTSQPTPSVVPTVTAQPIAVEKAPSQPPSATHSRAGSVSSYSSVKHVSAPSSVPGSLTRKTSGGSLGPAPTGVTESTAVPLRDRIMTVESAESITGDVEEIPQPAPVTSLVTQPTTTTPATDPSLTVVRRPSYSSQVSAPAGVPSTTTVTSSTSNTPSNTTTTTASGKTTPREALPAIVTKQPLAPLAPLQPALSSQRSQLAPITPSPNPAHSVSFKSDDGKSDAIRQSLGVSQQRIPAEDSEGSDLDEGDEASDEDAASRLPQISADPKPAPKPSGRPPLPTLSHSVAIDRLPRDSAPLSARGTNPATVSAPNPFPSQTPELPRAGMSPKLNSLQVSGGKGTPTVLSSINSQRSQRSNTSGEMRSSQVSEKAKRAWRKFASQFRYTPNDFLKAMGAMPAGICTSELSNLMLKGKHTPGTEILPPLNVNGLRWDLIEMDHMSGRLKPIYGRCFKVELAEAIDIPLPSSTVEVLSRGVHVCLHNQVKPLGNVFTIHCNEYNPVEPNTWRFNNRNRENMCLVRTTSTDINMCVMLELFATVIKPKEIDTTTGQPKPYDLSCGWCLIPIGADIESMQFRSYEQELKGGIFTSPQAFDPKDVAPLSRFEAFRGVKRVARLNLRLREGGARSGPQCSRLPANFITSGPLAEPLSLYREMVAESLLKKASPSTVEPIQDMALAVFPQLINHQDICDALGSYWTQRKSVWPSQSVENYDFLCTQLRSLVEDMYPLLSLVEMKDIDINKRRDCMQRFMLRKAEAALLTEEFVCEPFDLREIVFDPFKARSH